MSTSADGLADYEFYCFDGDPRFLYVSKGLENHSTARISFLTMDWKFQPFARSDYESFGILPEKPRSFEHMATCAKVLSAGIPFVRADFYDYGEQGSLFRNDLLPLLGLRAV